MNQCFLTGNLGADPEVFYTSEGVPVATFNLAFTSGKKKTNWLKVVSFNKLAEVCQTYLHKGARVAVIGPLEQEKWESKEGESRTSYKLLANSVEFIRTDGRGFPDGKQTDEVPF